MPTSANIYTPWGQTYHLEGGGYPDGVRDFFSEARNKTDSGSLESVFNSLAQGEHDLEEGEVDALYNYTLHEEGNVTFKSVEKEDPIELY